MYRLYSTLLYTLVLISCGGGGNSTTQPNSENTVQEDTLTNELSNSGLYKPQEYNAEQLHEAYLFDEYKLTVGSQVSLETYRYELDSGTFESLGNIAFGDPVQYYTLTDLGWELKTTKPTDPFFLKEDGSLLFSEQFQINLEYTFQSETVLDNKDIATSLGEQFSWAIGKNFSQGAKLYSYQRKYPENNWIIQSRNCGWECSEVTPIGDGNLIGWIVQHQNSDNVDIDGGLSWNSLSLFFDLEGNVYTYNLINKNEFISSDSTWEIVTVNNEEILEITIDAETRSRTGVAVEFSPIIAKIDDDLFLGSKVQNTDLIPNELHNFGYLLNKTANNDLNNIIISIKSQL